MNFQETKELFLALKASSRARDAYTNLIPNDIVSGIFDNEYANSLSKDNDLLIYSLFSRQLAEEFFYFMYDWRGNPGESLTMPNGIEIVIDTEERFFDYIESEYFK